MVKSFQTLPSDAAIPVPDLSPGTVRIQRLAQEGRLSRGDTLWVHGRGLCEVAYVKSLQCICVCDKQGGHFSLDIEFGQGAVLVPRAQDLCTKT